MTSTSPRSLFAFGEATFDHNYSQGLSLQQTYNGGIGLDSRQDIESDAGS